MSKSNSDFNVQAEEVPTFAKYGIKFQELLVKNIIEDRSFADQIGEVIDPNYLESKHLQAVTKLIYEYREKFKTHPSYDIIASLIKSNSLSLAKEQEITQKQVVDFYARLISNELSEGAEYVKSTSLDFCRKQKIRTAMVQSIKLLKEASFDEISKLLNDSLRLGASNDSGTDFLVDFEKRYLPSSRSAVSTGWDLIDKITKGGLGKGELSVVIAATGRGKSHILVHYGAEAIKAGKNVIHYTLELSEEATAKRYDSCISGFSLDELSELKAEVFDFVKEVPGKLLVKQYPTKMVGTNTIRAHLDKMISRGFKPDLVIVDYGDLLKPPKGSYSGEKRHDLEAVFEDLRAIAISYGVHVATASQVHRASANEEVITMEAIAEAYAKCFIADFIISLSRTRKDEPTKGGRIFVAKNRNGADNLVFPAYVDVSSVTIRVLPIIETKTVEQINEDAQRNTAKEQLQKVREVYQKEIKNKKKGEKVNE